MAKSSLTLQINTANGLLAYLEMQSPEVQVAFRQHVIRALAESAIRTSNDEVKAEIAKMQVAAVEAGNNLHQEWSNRKSRPC